MRKIISIIFCLWGCFVVSWGNEQVAKHPRIYTTTEERPLIWQKIKTQEWASQVWNKMKSYVDTYLAYYKKEPDWLMSRLAMYWKKGEHYTQCYLKEGVWEDGSKGRFPLVKNQQWDYGEGNAPVPTVRLPGMRTWNQYGNVPLKDRIPYNESGDMLGVSSRNPGKIIRVPYRETGHMIRGNNNEILDIALQASFIYFMTGDEDYAALAASVFYPWLMGTYYMNPVLDPEHSTGGAGGYAPGGLCGFYDYESIHDDLQTKGAPIYDFLFDYLKTHPYAPLTDTGKSLQDVCGEVFKKFLDVDMVRKGNTDNWNINAWDMMLPSALALEDNSFYADGKGRDYYLNFFVQKTTVYHESIPDMMKRYNDVTGLWPESPGYAFGTIKTVIALSLPTYKAGYDLIGKNPKIEKAAFAIFPWMDARGNVIVFGDARGGSADYQNFEHLLTYYSWTKDSAKIALMKSVIQKGIDTGAYKRSNTDWKGLIWNLSDCHSDIVYNSPMRMSYSPAHEMITMKNKDDAETGLMALLYGGGPGGKHLSSNGLAMQLYGFGWALAPDASGYESYWSPDYIYHQSVTGANTIAPGYVRGPITINAMEPAVPDTCYTNVPALSEFCQFADVSAGEKRRMLAIVRTSDSTGYYVDIFRSDLKDNDYIYHNLGDTLIVNNGKLPFRPVKELLAPVWDAGLKGDNSQVAYGKSYTYFTGVKTCHIANDIIADWKIYSDRIGMTMWMPGDKNRQLFLAKTPKPRHQTRLGRNMETPTIIVRQTNQNGWKHPFVAVFEPYKESRKTIRQVKLLRQDTSFVALQVESTPHLKGDTECQTILHATNSRDYHLKNDILWRGTTGILSEKQGKLVYLYLGKGYTLRKGAVSISSNVPASACLVCKNGRWYYSADKLVDIVVNGKVFHVSPANNKPLF